MFCLAHMSRADFSAVIHNIVPTIQAFHHQSPQHPLSTILISYIITDPLFIEAILFHAAVHVDMIHDRSWGQTTWYHRGQLMHQIRERMNSSQDTASDALILGIGMLGACGVSRAGPCHSLSVYLDSPILEHHWRCHTRFCTPGSVAAYDPSQGWYRQVGMSRHSVDISIYVSSARQTLSSIEFHFVQFPLTTANRNNRGDLISVTISRSKPGVERPRLDSTPSPLFDGLWGYSFLTKHCNSEASLESNRMRIREIIQLISRLATMYRTSYKVLSTTSSHMTTFTHVCCAAEHQLLSLELIPPAESDSSSGADVLIYEAARNAALICSTYLFRRLRPQAAILVSLQQALRYSIMACDHDNLEHGSCVSMGSMRLLLWSICVGRATALDPNWYTVYMKSCISNLKIQSERELRACLEEYIWEPYMDVELIW